LKVHGTRMLEMCAREASQILGGNAYLRTGPGARIERIYRETRVVAIGGGSEEILLDLAVRVRARVCVCVCARVYVCASTRTVTDLYTHCQFLDGQIVISSSRDK
jgi:hypothetical protein